MPQVGRSPPPETARVAEDQNNMEINELRRILTEQQQRIEQLQQQQIGQAGNQGVAILAEGNLAHFSIRDALEAVPNYDGENIPFVYFVEGCEEALSMIAPTQENILVRAIRNKLKGDAHRSILGRIFNNMREIVEFLRAKYGPRETVYEAQGRLAYLCQKKDEKVATYANRVRELGKRIIDAQKREIGQVSAEFTNSIENNLKTCFLRGLNKELTVSREGTFEEIESRAIDAEKELETINMIRRVVLAENTTTERRAPTRRIEAIEVVCQYCHKRGHTADRCRSIIQHQQQMHGQINYARNISRPNQSNRFIPQIPSQSYQNPYPYTGTIPRALNHNQFTNSRNQNQYDPNQRNSIISCKYCKKLGHTIEECRKRAYNNNNNNKNNNSDINNRGQESSSNQGNQQTPVRTGATSGQMISRPTRVIHTQESTESEQ